MTKTEIIDLINKNPASHLATVDGTRPRVRGMLIYRADEQGIIFHWTMATNFAPKAPVVLY